MPEPLRVNWTNKITNFVSNSEKVNLQISGVGNYSRKYHIKNARTVTNLSLTCQSFNFNDISMRYEYLKHTDIADLKSAIPTILIDLGNANLMVPIETSS